MTYQIVRFYQDSNHPDHRKVIRTGLTLDEAQTHCRDPLTHDVDWFDGYEAEQTLGELHEFERERQRLDAYPYTRTDEPHTMDG